MKKVFCLVLVCYLLPTSPILAQDLRLPKDTDKLIARAQKFWSSLASGQRLQALEFVLPEKKNLFLTGNPVPVLSAKVQGVDLTVDPDQATVRVSLRILGVVATSGEVNWTIADPWVWRKGNWYVNLEDATNVFPKAAEKQNIEEAQQSIDKNFEILRNPVDLGKLTDGQHFSIEVPIRYTGDMPLSVELAIPNPIVDLPVSNAITSGSKNFRLLVGTDNWDGPFNLPVVLRIRYGEATVERTLMLQGEVFVPIAFRQEPPNGPIEEGREFSVFIRNNAVEPVGVQSITTDAKLDLVKWPDTLPPGQETEIVFKLRHNQSPDALYLDLAVPLNGRKIYTYRFRNSRP
jgi:hypothetical protein